MGFRLKGRSFFPSYAMLPGRHSPLRDCFSLNKNRKSGEKCVVCATFNIDSIRIKKGVEGELGRKWIWIILIAVAAESGQTIDLRPFVALR